MSGNVSLLKLEATTVAEDLRALADRIDRGEEFATSAIVVFHDRPSAITGRTICGERIAYSAWMGLLSYASHMLYNECRNDG